MPDPAVSLLAVVVWLYWGRVGVMSWRIRRRTGALSGVLPVQGVERFLWLFFVPVVASWLAFPLLALGRQDGPMSVPAFARDLPWSLIRIGGAVAGAILLAATVRCWRRMGRHWKMSVTPGERQVLITDGPFARVRHPIYGYQILLMFASLVVLPTIPMLVLAGTHLALMIAKARNEERHLLGVHGPVYASYVERTGRFFPGLSR